jgi:hypothetical protein
MDRLQFVATTGNRIETDDQGGLSSDPLHVEVKLRALRLPIGAGPPQANSGECVVNRPSEPEDDECLMTVLGKPGPADRHDRSNLDAVELADWNQSVWLGQLSCCEATKLNRPDSMHIRPLAMEKVGMSPAGNAQMCGSK